MSDSRLEKFIYAICSMDVSDLPVPLSRIEKLWNCLITGETPDFEPLSRNEKYLMAMLDRYDISNLPAPMSRGEKLLYKIAVGETDLSDVPGYLSQYEELLKYLIENGGISGGDFEYVLYTLNQSLYTLYTTAEKPVKSAILSGSTLVNIVNNDNWKQGTGLNKNLFTQNISIKKGQTYTVIGKMEKSDIDASDTKPAFRIRVGDGEGGTSLLFVQEYDTNIKQTFTNNENDTIHLRFFNQKTNYKKLMIVEGDYTNVDIPYFEGIQSVKMPVLTTTGKNLFGSEIEFGGFYGSDGLPYMSTDRVRSKTKTLLKKGTYTLSCENATNTAFSIWNTDDTFYGEVVSDEKNTFTFDDDVLVNVVIVGGDLLNNKIQLEQGSTATSYEPYKSNILSTSEEVTLRGIGEVKDTLDCLTGELTERIGEIVLDGNESYTYSIYNQSTTSATYRINTVNQYKANTKHLCNKLPSKTSTALIGSNSIYLSKTDNSKNIYIELLSNITGGISIELLKEYLKSNPIIINFEQFEKSVKTVDLTVVDQDNQPTQLGTFENVTHVSLEAENLIPEVEMEVATHISEELASASTLMNDISTEQQQLNETVNEQSNNVDATMIATTEIFEEIL